MEQIICIREHPEWLERAADYFTTAWNIDRALYHESMLQSAASPALTPNWYLLLRGERILGCCGVIDNDFMVEPTFTPWLCALYVEPEERGKQYGFLLLNHVRREAARFGVEKVYLNTDHTSYYERYGWRYLGDFPHASGENTRVYESDALEELEEMSGFFDRRAESYDAHMLVYLDLEEFYQAVDNCFVGQSAAFLLDLGCGTGLELERLFRRFPELALTGIDLSAGMLEELRRKYPARQIRTICASYFDVELGEAAFDHALSTYSLHHFSEEEKGTLYRKILHALKPGGLFVLGDYTVATLERQNELLDAKDRIYRERGSGKEFYHFDTPFTADTEMRLLHTAGFARAELIRQWENTSIIVARKSE